MVKRSCVCFLGVCFSLFFAPITSDAQQIFSATGVISQISLCGPTNYAFRIYLNGKPISGCNAGFLYMNTNNGNYQAYVATLLTAYSAQKTITVQYVLDSGGFCAIGDLSD